MFSSYDVAIEDPCLPLWRKILQSNQCNIIRCPVSPSYCFFDTLTQSSAQLAITTPSHQFPTGHVMTYSERKRLLTWGAENGTYIIEDDYDCEFLYESRNIPCLKSMDSSDIVIYISTFSKILGPGFRVNYMVLPKSLLDSFYRHFAGYPSDVSWLIQKSIYYFISTDDFARHIHKVRTLFHKKIKLLTQTLLKIMGNHIHIIGTEEGLQILICVSSSCNQNTLLDAAHSHNIGIYSASQYWSNPLIAPKNVFMLGISYISENEIETGIEELYKAWKDYLE